MGASVWGFFTALIVVGGVQAPFINAIPSFPFNCFLSLEVFTSRQLQMKCSGLLQWKQHFSSAWASFTALAHQTMNFSVTPLIPPGSSLPGSSPSSASSSSTCAKQTAGFFWKWLVTLKFPQGEEASSPQFGGPSAVWFLELWGTLLSLPSWPPWWPLGSLNMFSPVDPPSGRLALLLIT